MECVIRGASFGVGTLDFFSMCGFKLGLRAANAAKLANAELAAVGSVEWIRARAALREGMLKAALSDMSESSLSAPSMLWILVGLITGTPLAKEGPAAPTGVKEGWGDGVRCVGEGVSSENLDDEGGTATVEDLERLVTVVAPFRMALFRLLAPPTGDGDRFVGVAVNPEGVRKPMLGSGSIGEGSPDRGFTVATLLDLARPATSANVARFGLAEGGAEYPGGFKGKESRPLLVITACCGSGGTLPLRGPESRDGGGAVPARPASLPKDTVDEELGCVAGGRPNPRCKEVTSGPAMYRASAFHASHSYSLPVSSSGSPVRP